MTPTDVFSASETRNPSPTTSSSTWTPGAYSWAWKVTSSRFPFAVRIAGNKPFLFSSDFPHEVNNATAKEEIQELRDNPRLTDDDKAAILHANARRFYQLG